MWKDGRCYEVLTPPEECEDMYDLQRKDNEEEAVIVDDDQKVEDLLVVACQVDVSKRYIVYRYIGN